ncbi:MAG: phosphotransferase [Candidatus Dojkabacteria bacterium]
MDLETAIKHYLEDKYGKDITLKEITKLGSGLVADGYKVVFINKGVETKIVCRQLRGIGLSRDYLADNVGYLLLQHQISQIHPTHINSIDVVCYGEEVRTVSIDGIENVFQVMEFAEGKSYIEFISKISKEETLSKQQKEIIENISSYMARIHEIKPMQLSDEIFKHYYWRHSQDYIGSEVFMDIMDVWDNDKLLDAQGKTEMMTNLFRIRESLRSEYKRCSMIHSDLHPDNIRVQEDLTIRPLDSARAMWGEPADDLTSMLANFIYFGLKNDGSLKGSYLEAYNLMLNKYIELTQDKDISKHAQLYLPVRLLILAHPDFFSSDTLELKNMLINFAKKILNDSHFDLLVVPKLLSI